MVSATRGRVTNTLLLLAHASIEEGQNNRSKAAKRPQATNKGCEAEVISGCTELLA